MIFASQVLESSLTSSKPTKSEMADIANAILDGADCIALSKETSIGPQPQEALTALCSLCVEAEAAVYQKQVHKDLVSTEDATQLEALYALAVAATECAQRCCAAAIIATTVTGRCAKVLAKYRPRCPVIAVTRFAHVARKLRLHRGIKPFVFLGKYRGHSIVGIC